MPRTGLTAEELHDRALDAAEEEIRRSGAARMKLTDVARRMELSHAALYKHFADKEALMDGVSERWLSRIDNELEKVAAKNKSAEARISEWFLSLHRLKRDKVSRDPELFAAFNMSAEKTRPFVMDHLNTTQSQLRRMCADALKDGVFRNRSAQACATALFEGTIAFHHPRLVVENLGENREAGLRALLKVLFAGLGS